MAQIFPENETRMVMSMAIEVIKTCKIQEQKRKCLKRKAVKFSQINF